MAQKIMIEPVTRIEGHAKVGVYIDDAGKVEKAIFHVNEFRGFEKFCEGRMFFEMPLITERICGICPVSHHLASAKACDQIVGVEPPRPASLLRELMHMGQIIQSHSMHFFELGGPDLLLGFDCDPAMRNVVGLYGANPELTVKAIKLRKFGQEIIARLGGRRVHPNFAVPGGVNAALKPADREAMLAELDEMLGYVQDGLAVIKGWVEANGEDLAKFGVFPTGYLGMVDQNNAVQLYDGDIRLVDQAAPAARALRRPQLPGLHRRARRALDLPEVPVLQEARLAGWRLPRRPAGPPQRGAERWRRRWRSRSTSASRQLRGGKVVEGTLYYHYARLIEDLYAVEHTRELLEDPDILSHRHPDQPPGDQLSRAWASSKPRAARCGTTTGSTRTAS